jgi:hypothetical protein
MFMTSMLASWGSHLLGIDEKARGSRAEFETTT